MEESVFAAHAALEQTHWWFVGRRSVVSAVIDEVMKPSPDKLIVDVGCGTGGTVAHLTGRYRCIGFDSSKIGIAAGKRLYPNVDMRLMDSIHDLRTVSPEADLYLLMDVLEHIEDDKGFLRDVVGMAKPGSHILITVPANPALWSIHDVTAGHVRRYVPDTLTQVWNGLPVAVRLFTYFNARLYPIIRAIRSLNALMGRTSGQGGTDFNLPARPINSMLASIFGGERDRVRQLIDNGSGAGYASGVSLIAVLKKL